MDLEFLKLSQSLIEFPSSSDNPKAKRGIVGFVKNYLKKERVFVKTGINNNFPYLVATLKKEKSPKIFLVGHLDVVGADKKDFIPKIKKGRIYGRGTADMKTQDAIMIDIFKRFANKSPRPSLGLMLTTDEEMGGRNGVNFLLNDQKYGCELAIVPDGGKDLLHIVIGEKGVLHLKITFFGKSAHGARPYLGENAMDSLIDFYSKIKKTVHPLTEKSWNNSLNLGKIEGGKAPNVVPDEAALYLDFRFVKKGDKEKFLKKVAEIIGDKKAKLEIMAEGAVFSGNTNNIFLRKWIKTAKEFLKDEITFDKEDGASDARFFAEKDIQVLITRPKFANNHTNGEWVDVRQSVLLHKMISRYLENVYKLE